VTKHYSSSSRERSTSSALTATSGLNVHKGATICRADAASISATSAVESMASVSASERHKLACGSTRNAYSECGKSRDNACCNADANARRREKEKLNESVSKSNNKRNLKKRNVRIQRQRKQQNSQSHQLLRHEQGRL